MAGFEGSSHRRRDGVQLDLIATTRHDEHAEADYRLVARCGLRTVRDALRWHAIERSPGHWDWSSFLPMLRAAAKAGTQVIWDLCHYGLPHDIDIWSSAFPDRFAAFAAAAARIVREETDAVPFWCPVNEISYWAWAGGEHALMYPHARERGAALKRQLVRAALAGIAALREVDGRTRFVTAEPLINVVPPPWSPEEAEAAEAHRLAQFEVCDMIAGHSAPELGGTADCLDIVGLNFYYDNQWFRSGPTIGLGHPAYRPLRSLLREVHLRYRRSLLIAETGAEGESGPGWLRYVGGEVRAGLRAGVPVEGVCIYPVMDYPGWENLRHCRCGLIRAEDEWRVRLLDPDLHHQLLEEQALSVPNTGSLTQPGAGAS